MEVKKRLDGKLQRVKKLPINKPPPSTIKKWEHSYELPHYEHWNNLPQFVYDFKDNSGFDYTRGFFKKYDSSTGSYQNVKKQFNDFLLFRALNGELDTKLPIHPRGDTYVVEIQSTDALTILDVIHRLTSLIRKEPIVAMYRMIQPKHQNKKSKSKTDDEIENHNILYDYEENSTVYVYRLFFRFKEKLHRKDFDNLFKHLYNQIRHLVSNTYKVKYILPEEALWIDLPGSSRWKTLLPEPYHKKMINFGFIPIISYTQIANRFSKGCSSTPIIFTHLRKSKATFQRENMVSFARTSTNFAYGAGTRHIVQPKIALSCLTRYGDDYNMFVSQCERWDGGSKDMAKRNTKDRILKTVWKWAQNHHYSQFNNISLYTSMSTLNSKIALKYNMAYRDEKIGYLYNPILQNYENIRWWYSPNFRFNPTLKQNLHSILQYSIHKAGITNSISSAGRLARKGVEFYALLFEQGVWHEYERINKPYVGISENMKPLEKGVCISKEYRRRIAYLFKIPQYTKLWSIFKLLGLVKAIQTTDGHTYSYKGEYKYAEHFQFPLTTLHTYVETLFQLLKASKSSVIDVNTIQGIEHINNHIISFFIDKKLSPSHYIYYYYKNTSKNTINTSNTSNTYNNRHNLCVKRGMESRAGPSLYPSSIVKIWGNQGGLSLKSRLEISKIT